MTNSGLYIVHVWRDAEPSIKGPYKTRAARGSAAEWLGKDDRDGIYLLTIDKDGKPIIE